MDDERGSMIKENNGDRWSSNSMMLLLRRWQNWDEIEWWRELLRSGWPFYCSGEREVTVVRIQYFSFGLRGEAMGRSVTVIWSGVNELILTLWKWSVARRGGVAMLTGGETVPGSGKGEDSSTTKHGRWRFKATVHRTINTFLPRDGIKSICLKILENICSWSSFVHLIA
jgi:hypothetical protein